MQMSEDLVKQLSSYKAQLQQVEVALSTDPENEDLRKLQKDLQVCVNKLYYSAGFAHQSPSMLFPVFESSGWLYLYLNPTECTALF